MRRNQYIILVSHLASEKIIYIIMLWNENIIIWVK